MANYRKGTKCTAVAISYTLFDFRVLVHETRNDEEEMMSRRDKA